MKTKRRGFTKQMFTYVVLTSSVFVFIFISVVNEKFKPLPRIRLNSSDIDKYIIYTCTGEYYCGGWADRLKGIVTSYLISLVTNRKFGIHITNPNCNFTDYFQPNLVDWRVDVNMMHDYSDERINHIDRDTFRKLASTANFNALLKEEIIFYSGNYEFITDLQKNPYHAFELLWMKDMFTDEIFSYILRYLFKLNNDLVSVLNRFMKRARPNNHTSKLICAHIRMGRNPTIPKDTEIRLNADQIETVWKFLKDNLSNDSKIFVSTDSQEVLKKAKRAFPNDLVDNPGQISHIERSKTENICDAMAKVVLDQYILARCDTLMVSHSGFGWIAAYLREKKEDLYCLLRGKISPCLPINLEFLYKKLK